MGACIAPEAPKGPPAQVISSPPADYTGRNNYQKSPTMASSINTAEGQQLPQNQQYQQQPLQVPSQQNTVQANLNHQGINNIDSTTTATNSQQQTATTPSAPPPSAPTELQQSTEPPVQDRVKTLPISFEQQQQSSDKQNDHNSSSQNTAPPSQPPPPQTNGIATNETNHNMANDGNDSGEDDEEVEAVDVNEEVVKQYMSYEEQIIRLKKTYNHQKLDHSLASIKALEDNIGQATKKYEDLKRQT